MKFEIDVLIFNHRTNLVCDLSSPFITSGRDKLPFPLVVQCANTHDAVEILKLQPIVAGLEADQSLAREGIIHALLTSDTFASLNLHGPVDGNYHAVYYGRRIGVFMTECVHTYLAETDLFILFSSRSDAIASLDASKKYRASQIFRTFSEALACMMMRGQATVDDLNQMLGAFCFWPPYSGFLEID